MKTLGEFIVEKQHYFLHATSELTALLSGINLGAKIIYRDINKAGLVDILGTSRAENVQGEVQIELDLFANEKLKARGHVASIASEEDKIVVFDGVENCKYVVLMDPLDGSSNIDVNVSVVTIFSIYWRITPVGTPVTEEEFLQTINKQVAVGYVVYGSSTMLVYTTGCGVYAFTYDPSLEIFCLSYESVRFPATGQMYSINDGQTHQVPQRGEKIHQILSGNGQSHPPPPTPRATSVHRFLIFIAIYLKMAFISIPVPRSMLTA